MSIFAIADLHLSFAPGIDKPMDAFGDRWYNHAERLKEAWSGNVTDKDTVVIAGDISWGLKQEEAMHDIRWIDSLPGHKVIIKGNHDLWWTGIKRLNSISDTLTFLSNDAYEAEGVWICGSRGWITPDDDDFGEADRKVYNREILRLRASLEAAPAESEKIGFLHFPPAVSPGSYSGFMQTFEDYGIREVYYGHLHGPEGFRRGMQGEYHGISYRLISLDYLNCVPLRIR